jgi:hypothetical protein
MGTSRKGISRMGAGYVRPGREHEGKDCQAAGGNSRKICHD